MARVPHDPNDLRAAVDELREAASQMMARTQFGAVIALAGRLEAWADDLDLGSMTEPEATNLARAIDMVEALHMYADPDSYFAVAILPDRPAGEFADDYGCVLFQGEHDHRHGRRARKVLGDEWWGTEPCEEMLAQIAKEQDQ